MNLDCGGRSLALDRIAIMGVLNVTPDSFSDGALHQNVSGAINHGVKMVAAGADLIDVGGESTRPGSRGTDAAEEIRRVVPVIRELATQLSVPISVDTSKPDVMIAAVEAGAGLINDVCALQSDGAMNVARELNVPICLMHMQGRPETMQNNPYYLDVVKEVLNFLRERIDSCEKNGIPEHQLLIDPGFGFGKRFDHNRSLLLELKALTQLGRPIVTGLSRKKFVGMLLGDFHRDRCIASAGLALLAAQNGAQIVRVHDVGPTWEIIRTWENLYRSSNSMDSVSLLRKA